MPEAARIEEAVTQVEERLPAPQAEQVERYVRAHFADASPAFASHRMITSSTRESWRVEPLPEREHVRVVLPGE